jgi:urease accessory protein
LEGWSVLQARSWLPRTEGSVRLGLARTGGETRVADLYQAGAGRVRFPSPGPAGQLEAVLLNTAGGLTGGDRMGVEVTLTAGCGATVTSAAAEKIYRSLEGDAEVRIALSLAGNARLAWLPQPTILFDRARLDRLTEVRMTAGATLLAAELLIFGRAAMGEDVHSGTVRDRWRVRRDGKLVFADTFLADGPVASILDRGATLDGMRANALVLYAAPDAASRLDAVRLALQDAASTAGASTWNDLLVVRAAARDGRTLQTDLEPALALLAGAPLPRVWQC